MGPGSLPPSAAGNRRVPSRAPRELCARCRKPSAMPVVIIRDFDPPSSVSGKNGLSKIGARFFTWGRRSPRILHQKSNREDISGASEPVRADRLRKRCAQGARKARTGRVQARTGGHGRAGARVQARGQAGRRARAGARAGAQAGAGARARTRTHTRARTRGSGCRGARAGARRPRVGRAGARVATKKRPRSAARERGRGSWGEQAHEALGARCGANPHAVRVAAPGMRLLPRLPWWGGINGERRRRQVCHGHKGYRVAACSRHVCGHAQRRHSTTVQHGAKPRRTAPSGQGYGAHACTRFVHHRADCAVCIHCTPSNLRKRYFHRVKSYHVMPY